MVILLIAHTCSAQQDPQFSQYMYSDFCINPAIAGSAGICATTLFRQQWAGFSESYIDENGETKTSSVSPQEIVFNLHSPVKFLHGGVGASFYRDQEGHQNNIDIKLALRILKTCRFHRTEFTVTCIVDEDINSAFLAYDEINSFIC